METHILDDLASLAHNLIWFHAFPHQISIFYCNKSFLSHLHARVRRAKPLNEKFEYFSILFMNFDNNFKKICLVKFSKLIEKVFKFRKLVDCLFCSLFRQVELLNVFRSCVVFMFYTKSSLSFNCKKLFLCLPL